MQLLLILWLAVAPAMAAPKKTPAPPTFDAWWHDGKAELDGYRFHVSRYGHERVGYAVLVYVTEPFSASRNVKVEDPKRRPDDTFDAFKLNLVRRFQTGIYDYQTMVSLFLRTADFVPLKETFSSAEWCGHVFEGIDFRGGRTAHRFDSYFEDESSSGNVPTPAGGVIEDELFVRLRGLRSPWLKPGETRTVPYLAGAFWRRLTHRPLAWGRATIQRLPAPQTMVVPAGAFACDVYVVHPDDGREGKFYVERAWPRRVARWAWTAPRHTPRDIFLGGDDSGELTGSDRLEYWKLHNPGDESHLSRLGLPPAVR